MWLKFLFQGKEDKRFVFMYISVCTHVRFYFNLCVQIYTLERCIIHSNEAPFELYILIRNYFNSMVLNVAKNKRL